MSTRKKKISANEESFLNMIQKVDDEINDHRIKVQDKMHIVSTLIHKFKDDETLIAVLTKSIADLLKLNENNITSRLRLAKLTSDHITKKTRIVSQAEGGGEQKIDFNNIGEAMKNVKFDDDIDIDEN
jgi:hypothetical protein